MHQYSDILGRQGRSRKREIEHLKVGAVSSQILKVFESIRILRNIIDEYFPHGVVVHEVEVVVIIVVTADYETS